MTCVRSINNMKYELYSVVYATSFSFFKCPYNQQGFCGFGVSITSKNVFTPKQFLAIKSSLKVPASATPNDVDRKMKIGDE